jgi:hypothetical protein
MRLPDSPDGYDRWLNLPDVPVPTDVEPDGRSMCDSCQMTEDLADAIEDMIARAAKVVRS